MDVLFRDLSQAWRERRYALKKVSKTYKINNLWIENRKKNVHGTSLICFLSKTIFISI